MLFCETEIRCAARQSVILLDIEHTVTGAVLCRLAMHLGKRVGGQGLVVFAQHAKVRTRKFAVKFFLSSSAFEVEMAAALNPVRPAVTCVCCN